MKISSELILQCNQFINPLYERQLDMRSKKISAIENLGATLDFFENIDLSDNDIKRLGNFTLLKRYQFWLMNKRLKTLNLSNNKISRLTDVSDSLPFLENLCLMNNKISDVNEIFTLRNCTKIKRLILFGNVVTQGTNYRLQVIGALPSLRTLDFSKVTPQERAIAIEKFKLTDQADLIALAELQNGSLPKDQLKQLIQNAKTLEEINKIEILLKQNQIAEEEAAAIKMVIEENVA